MVNLRGLLDIKRIDRIPNLSFNSVKKRKNKGLIKVLFGNLGILNE